MVGIEGDITIARPVDVVFDYVADQTNEPQYNPRMVRAQKVGAAPIGRGTTFRSAGGGRAAARADLLIEITDFDRPRLPGLGHDDGAGRHPLRPALRAGRRRNAHELDQAGHQPKGRCTCSVTLIAWLGRRQEERIWQSMKVHLEHERAAEP